MQVLVEKLAGDVEGRREQMQSLRDQVKEMQAVIQRRLVATSSGKHAREPDYPGVLQADREDRVHQTAVES